MVVLSHGGIMKKVYKFLRYGIFNEERHVFNFVHEDGICEDSSVENVCVENG